MAYSACGNLALSEDVAQETFWTAWRQRASLEQPDRLKAWLCGIARNLAKNARRKASRPVESAETQDVLSELSTDEPGPAEEAVSREEESLVWQALERIPEAYREPLILFYREDQSVAEVAGALVLSEDAVKQRLSRGRGMLREQVAELVEGGLRRSRPGRRFTVTVMAGLAAHAAGAKTALAGAGPVRVRERGRRAGAAGAAGALGGLLGTLGGLLGGWLGTWVPAQAAPTRRERDAILRAGWRMLLVSVCLHRRLVRVDLRVRRQAQLPDRLGRLDGRVLGVHRCRVRPPGPGGQAHPRRARSGRLTERDGAACRLDRDGHTVRRPGLPERSDPPRAPPDRHQPRRLRCRRAKGSPSARPPPTAGGGSLAAGSRSATTPEASCWRSARRPADWSHWAAVPSAS